MLHSLNALSFKCLIKSWVDRNVVQLRHCKTDLQLKHRLIASSFSQSISGKANIIRNYGRFPIWNIRTSPIISVTMSCFFFFSLNNNQTNFLIFKIKFLFLWKCFSLHLQQQIKFKLRGGFKSFLLAKVRWKFRTKKRKGKDSDLSKLRVTVGAYVLKTIYYCFCIFSMP